MKKCPNCSDCDLIAQKISANVEVDACPKCGGVWFEKGEVGDFTNFAKDIPDIARLAKEAKSSGKNCPECGLGMKEMKYTGSCELMIDYCESCSGVWFDGGELGELKAISEKLEDVKLRISREVWNLRFNLHKRSALTCPKCLAKTLHTFNTSEGVTVDLCDKCRGMWMDKGETARAAELETDFPDYRAVAGSAVLTNLICPCCGSKLHNMKYAPNSDLKIEYCQKCGGMFLDAGEMSKIETISANSEGAGKKLVRCLKQMHDEGYVKLN